MPPGGEGAEHGSMVQGHPPATVRRDEEAPPHSTPPLPFIIPEKRQKLEQEQQLAASLPEGALVEILSRVPYRSFCRFKCVSKPWLALCSARDILKRSPKALSGFFYYTWSPQLHPRRRLHFRNLSGRGPPLVDPFLTFLRQSYDQIAVYQVCGGFLLCSCGNSTGNEDSYVVCNPATEEWTVLPRTGYPCDNQFTFLGFDAAVPSRFVVFAPQPEIFRLNNLGEVAIYSSETGRWTYVQTTVDSEGRVWREIGMPGDLPNICDIGHSQGRLYAWQIDDSHNCQLYIWVLEDYDTGNWCLKHTDNVLELFGRNCREDGDSYVMFAIHPDCNVIFLTDTKNMTLSYDMDNQKVHVICTEGMYGLPYVPCFAELPSAGH